MKKRLLFFVVLVVLLVGGLLVYMKDRPFTVRITQRQVDAALAEHFPMRKTHLMILDLTYENPVAELLEERDRVRVGMDASLTVGVGREPRTFTGSAAVTTSVRYDPATFSFYLSDVEMERLEIEGIPTRYTEQAGRLALSTAQEFVEAVRIYQIEGEDARTTLAKMVLKDVEVRDRTVWITFGL